MPAPANYSRKLGEALKGATFEFGVLLENELNIFLNEEDLVVSRKMQASIESVTRLDEGELEVLVGPTIHYAEYVHDGTGPAAGNDRYFPPPSALINWVQKRGFAAGEGTPEERAKLLAWHIYQHGTEPNPFLERFNQQKGEKLAGRFHTILQKRINQTN